jgi:hypothetical protein
MARPFHFFGMYGMGGHFTDPGEDVFTGRVKAAFPHIDCHASPYNDQQAGEIAALIDQLPEIDGVFVQGTSLGSNNTPVACGYTKHTIDGAFGFQASLYGYHSSLTANVKFAHLIYSYNPIPWPGLGAYLWGVGTMHPASYHRTPHHIPHPGDYDVGDQNMFIAEMGRIQAA